MHKGFTLIELLIVICILGILLGTIMPKLANRKQELDALPIAEYCERYAHDRMEILPVKCLNYFSTKQQ